MAMKHAIFNRPVRIGKDIYHKSKRSVEIDEKFLQSKTMKALIDSGEIAILDKPVGAKDEQDDSIAPSLKEAVKNKKEK